MKDKHSQSVPSQSIANDSTTPSHIIMSSTRNGILRMIPSFQILTTLSNVGIIISSLFVDDILSSVFVPVFSLHLLDESDAT